MSRTRTPISHALRTVALVVSASLTFAAVSVIADEAPVSAKPKPCQLDDPTCDPGGGGGGDGTQTYEPADTDLTYVLLPRVGGWKQAWKSRQDTNKKWAVETYDPRYVFPTAFASRFGNQCVDKADFDAGLLGNLTINTYRWTVDGKVTDFNTCYRTELSLPGEGDHTVRLDVRSPAGTTIVSKQRTVKVVDHLIVLFGDSMASGEGSPEQNRKKGAEFGTWIDKRCHRSSWAAVPRAVEALEDADPYSTVTFLNFACSGATLGDWVQGAGSGVLGPYNGIEPIVEFDAEDEGADPTIVQRFYLPSQVDQLKQALGVKVRYGNAGNPSQTVDKLFVSGGINDVRFAELSIACIIETDCVDKTTSFYGGQETVGATMATLASHIPARWNELDQALTQRGIQTVPGGRYAMEYPDAFTNSNGNLCSEMLADVLPQTTVVWILGVVLPALVALTVFLATAPIAAAAMLVLTIAIGAVGIALGIPNIWAVLFNGLTGDLRFSSGEINWLSSTGNALLGDAVRIGATAAGFTYVDGIADLFKGHGYCSSDRWLNTARDSSYLQGPYDFISKPLGLTIGGDGVAFGLDLQARTKGLVHPNRSGYKAVGAHLAAQLSNLILKPPVSANDVYDLDLATSPAGLTVPAAQGLLANDTDANGDVLKIATNTAPEHGSLTVAVDGGFTYVPEVGFEGWDNFTYRATDAGLQSAVTTVSIHVYNSKGPAWTWTVPNPVQAPIGQATRFPLCEQCGYLQPVANPGPTNGALVFDRVDADWFATFTPTVGLPGPFPLGDSAMVEMRWYKDVGAFELMGTKGIEFQILAADRTTTWTVPESVAAPLWGSVEFPLCTGCGALNPRVQVGLGPAHGSVTFLRDGDTGWTVKYQSDPDLSYADYVDSFGVELIGPGNDLVSSRTVTVQLLKPPA